MTDVANDAFDAYDEEDDTLEDTYLTFSVREEEYALPVMNVTEIIRLQTISEVPDMPDCFKGVINLRGRVIPIMDVRRRFALPTRDYDDRTVVVVLDLAGTHVGLVVDSVSEVLEIDSSDIDPAPRTDHRQDRSVVKGMAKRQGAVSILLDVQSLLNPDQVAAVA